MEEKKYKDFTLYNDNEKNVFIHIDIESVNFYNKVLSYFFDENKLLCYIKNKTNITFQSTITDFVSLYKKINDFIDEENFSIDSVDFKKELERYIDWENYSREELLTLRRDKVGKIGEYIFHNILIEYFNLCCIIPKLNLVTNRNMSIYGIDVIFYDFNDNSLIFGESKVSQSLDNGINLINDSLKNYEHQISEEFRAILSSQTLPIENIPDEMKIYIDQCINFKKFIEVANIKKIGIPLFIMHGDDYDIDIIFEKLKKIKAAHVLGLEIEYIIISLPILDKNIFQTTLLQFLREKSDYFESHTE